MNWNTQRVAFATIFRQEVGRFMRIWKQTLLPPIITQSLYFIIFGGFIGSQVRNVGGVPYMQFIVPGLVMMAIINSSFMNVSFSFYAAKFQKSIEEILVAPVHPLTMISGYIASGAVRGLITGFIVFLVSLFFTRPSIHSFFILGTFSVLTALIFALGGFINAMYANSFDDAGTFSTFVITPLTFLGGVFYPISALPGIWKSLSRFNPIVYMVDGFRQGLTGSGDIPLMYSTAILLGTMILLIGINMWILKQGKLKS